MKFSTGSGVLDELLGGGYLSEQITTIYGAAASGKTTCCLLATIAFAKLGKKVIFFDTENGFNVERLKQLTPDYEKVLEQVSFLKADSFPDQKKKFEFLKEFFPNPKIGLIVVDTIGKHYRVDRSKDIKTMNNEFADQIDILRELYKGNELVVLVTNQVYADLDNKDEEKVKIVGGEIVRNRSKTIIQLQKLHENKRKAILEKLSGSDKDKEIIFEIKEKGFVKNLFGS